MKISKLASLRGGVNKHFLYQTEEPFFLYRQKLNDQNVNFNKNTKNNVNITEKTIDTNLSTEVLLAIDNDNVEYKEINLVSCRNNKTTLSNYSVVFVAIQLTQLALLGKAVTF